jgi:thiamine biosynthesis lipoprotein
MTKAEKPELRRALAPALLALLALAALLLLLRQGLPGFWGKPAPFTASALVMGTEAHLTLVSDNHSAAELGDIAEQAFAATRRVEQLMSAYRDDSDVGRLNAAKEGEWVELNPLTWQVLMESLRYYELTGGAFDVTVFPLSKLYHFENGAVKQMPDEVTVRETLARVGSDKILFKRDGMRVGFAVGGMKINLAAIAKGFGVDQAMEAVKRAGIENAIVEIGGEVRLAGHVTTDKSVKQQLGSGENPGGWKVGIRNPRDWQDYASTLELTDCAVATSGDYEQYFEFEGKRYSHILDPRTGYPVTGGAASVTVIHPDSCAAADALATSLSVMSLEQAREFVNRYNEISPLKKIRVILLVPDGGKVRQERLGFDGDGSREK